VGLIDQDLFYVLVKYYRGVEMLLVAVDARDPFAENEILPFSGDGPDRFYEGFELRPPSADQVGSMSYTPGLLVRFV